MTSLMTDVAWIKTSELIKEKYGKNLSYRMMRLISQDSENTLRSDYYLNGEDLVIPLKMKNSNLGDVVIKSALNLTISERQEITDLIKFLIEPKVYNIQLKQIEQNLKNAKSTTIGLMGPENILSIENSEKFIKQTLSQVILLKSHTEITRNKVALKLHEMTQRNLFVHLKDVLPSLSTFEDFDGLKDVTIYIGEIESITSQALDMVQDYLALNKKTGPLFLLGSSLSPEAIKGKEGWLSSFKNDLVGFYFDIDRVPLSQQTSEDVLELLFFQLDSTFT